MLDTIKLSIPYSQRPEWVAKVHQLHTLNVTAGVSRTNINPSSTHKKAGIYIPRLTYIERPTKNGRTYSLVIELSLPKLMFGNNFSELKDTDFDVITQELSDVLGNTYNICIPPDELATAKVGRIDYSKNILFTDYTPVITIIKSMKTADISKVYDVQDTDFRNGGHVYHIHTNSSDVAMYDKIADLKKEKISPKRSQEEDGYTQMNLINLLENKKSISIARLEVRLNSVRKIRHELEAVGVFCGITFRELYSTDISRKILLRHWNRVLDCIPKALLDTDTPEQLLLNIKRANPEMKAREALAVIGIKLLADKQEGRHIRNLMDELFPPHQYRKLLQKSREPPKAAQLKALLSITDTLTAMTPVSIDDHIL